MSTEKTQKIGKRTIAEIILVLATGTIVTVERCIPTEQRTPPIEERTREEILERNSPHTSINEIITKTPERIDNHTVWNYHVHGVDYVIAEDVHEQLDKILNERDGALSLRLRDEYGTMPWMAETTDETMRGSYITRNMYRNIFRVMNTDRERTGGRLDAEQITQEEQQAFTTFYNDLVDAIGSYRDEHPDSTLGVGDVFGAGLIYGTRRADQDGSRSPLCYAFQARQTDREFGEILEEIDSQAYKSRNPTEYR